MRTECPYFTLDLHHHVGVLAGHGADGGPDISSDVATRLAFLDEHHIDQCLLLPAQSTVSPDGRRADAAANDAVFAYRQRAPERFAASLATVDPRLGSAALEEIDRAVEELGAAGFVWHHHFLGTFINDPAMSGALERIRAHRLPVFVHVIAGSFLESLWRLGELADAFGDVTFVALDAFSHPDQAGSLRGFARQHPNVLFDTAAASSIAHFMPDFIAEVGAERLLFGSDFYSSPRMFAVPFALYELLNSPVDDNALEKVLGGNARSLLRLDQEVVA